MIILAYAGNAGKNKLAILETDAKIVSLKTAEYIL
jgi:hypothetical protein